MNTLKNIDRLRIEFTLKDDFNPELLQQIFLNLTMEYDDFKPKYVGYTHTGILFYGNYKIGKIYYSVNESKKKNLLLDFNKDLFCTEFSILDFMYVMRIAVTPVKESVTYLEIYKVSMDDYIWKSLFQVSTNLSTAYQNNKPLYSFNSKKPKRFHTMNDYKGFYIVNVDSVNDSVEKKQTAVIYLKTNLTKTQKDFYVLNSVMEETDNQIYKHEIRLFARSLRHLERKGYDVTIESILTPEFKEEILNKFMTESLTFKDLENYTYDHNRNKKYNLFKLWNEDENNRLTKVLKDSKPNTRQLKKRNNKPFLNALDYYYKTSKPEYFQMMTDEIRINKIDWCTQINNQLTDFNNYYYYFRLEEIKQEIQVFINKRNCEIHGSVFTDEIPF
jgi:hypothetical protein